jgi:quinol monooxygenase YgiN
MNMVITILQLKATPEKRLNIIKTIHAMIGPTKAQPGCLHCELFGNTQFLKVLAAMDTACEPPEINFYEIDSLAGMDLVEKVLGAKA